MRAISKRKEKTETRLISHWCLVFVLLSAAPEKKHNGSKFFLRFVLMCMHVHDAGVYVRAYARDAFADRAGTRGPLTPKC